MQSLSTSVHCRVQAPAVPVCARSSLPAACVRVCPGLTRCGDRAPLLVSFQDGCTALHWAAYNGHLAVVEALVAKGCDVKAVAKVRATTRTMKGGGRMEGKGREVVSSTLKR